MGGKAAITSIGQRFGRLIVTEVHTPKKGRALVIANCDCGGTWSGGISALRGGQTKSCGCLSSDTLFRRNVSHGMSGTTEYRAWKAMNNRCNNNNSKDYALYGGRGISVDPSWRNSFETFFADMGKRPSANHSIDRIDSNKNYCKENCRWATAIQQARNTSRNNRYLYKGELLTIREWTDKLSLPYLTIKSRIAEGWSVVDALETPVRPSRAGEKIVLNGEALTASEWAKRIGIGLTTFIYRMKAGWPPEALLCPCRTK